VFQGRVVQVQVKSGIVYEGIFHTACPDKGFGVVLKMAKRKDASVITHPTPTLIIPPKDFVQLIAKDVTFDVDDHSLDSLGDEGWFTSITTFYDFLTVMLIVNASLAVFHTDTDISGHNGEVRERELLPWVPDEDHPNVASSYPYSSFIPFTLFLFFCIHKVRYVFTTPVLVVAAAFRHVVCFFSREAC
jgi:hypothetical protein